MVKRKTPQEKLEDLRKKRDQLDAKIKKESANARAAARKEDTRRKIIAGAIALEHAGMHDEFGQYFRSLLKKHVKPEDLKLFELDT